MEKNKFLVFLTQFFFALQELYGCPLHDDAALSQSLRRVSYDAVALCTLSCAEMKATNSTMKGAAKSVSIRQVEAAHPHEARTGG